MKTWTTAEVRVGNPERQKRLKKKETSMLKEKPEDFNENRTYTVKVDHNPALRIATQQLLPHRPLQLLCNIPRNSSSKKLLLIFQIYI
jgi:hypothetical protein